MKFELRSVYEQESENYWEKTVDLPKHLPGPIGDKADQKLNAELDARQQGSNRDGSGNVKAKATISSKQFSEVTEYLYKAMISEYGDETVDYSETRQADLKKVAGHYFDQLNPFGIKKKES